MPIDPSIALKAAPSSFDLGQTLQNALTIRGMQQTNQLNQMKLAQAQQSADEENALRNYLTSSNLSTPEGLTGLYRYGSAGAGVAKSIAERQKLEQEGKTSAALGQKHLIDTAKAQQDWVSQSLQNMAMKNLF